MRMFNTDHTEQQYAFQLLDFASEKGELVNGSAYLIECRRELLKLVNEQVDSANFWHDRYIELAKKVMSLAGLPDDFKVAGLQNASEIIKKQQLVDSMTILKLKLALQKLLSYNEDIQDGKINYRPEDHIQVAKDALSIKER